MTTRQVPCKILKRSGAKTTSEMAYGWEKIKIPVVKDFILPDTHKLLNTSYWQSPLYPERPPGLDVLLESMRNAEIVVSEVTALSFYCNSQSWDGEKETRNDSGDGSAKNPFCNIEFALEQIHCILQGLCFDVYAVLHISGVWDYPVNSMRDFRGRMILDGLQKDGSRLSVTPTAIGRPGYGDPFNPQLLRYYDGAVSLYNMVITASNSLSFITGPGSRFSCWFADMLYNCSVRITDPEGPSMYVKLAVGSSFICTTSPGRINYLYMNNSFDCEISSSPSGGVLNVRYCFSGNPKDKEEGIWKRTKFTNIKNLNAYCAIGLDLASPGVDVKCACDCKISSDDFLSSILVNCEISDCGSGFYCLYSENSVITSGIYSFYCHTAVGSTLNITGRSGTLRTNELAKNKIKFNGDYFGGIESRFCKNNEMDILTKDLSYLFLYDRDLLLAQNDIKVTLTEKKSYLGIRLFKSLRLDAPVPTGNSDITISAEVSPSISDNYYSLNVFLGGLPVGFSGKLVYDIDIPPISSIPPDKQTIYYDVFQFSVGEGYCGSIGDGVSYGGSSKYTYKYNGDTVTRTYENYRDPSGSFTETEPLCN